MGTYDLLSFGDAEALARAAASRWLDELEAAGAGAGPYCVALSGGRIARRFFLAVRDQARARALLRDRIEFFWGDERCVPPGEPESNFRLAQECLLAPLDVPPARTHRIRGEVPPEAAAAEAESELQSTVHRPQATVHSPQSTVHSPRSTVHSPQSTVHSPDLSFVIRHSSFVIPPSGHQPVLDLVFLGMGEEGHVASLFPGEPDEVAESPAVYRAVTVPKPPPRRVTLGYPAICAARQVWVLASGPGKAQALRQSLAPAGNTPLARVLKDRAHTCIFTDILPGENFSGENQRFGLTGGGSSGMK